MIVIWFSHRDRVPSVRIADLCFLLLNLGDAARPANDIQSAISINQFCMVNDHEFEGKHTPRLATSVPIDVQNSTMACHLHSPKVNPHAAHTSRDCFLPLIM